MTKLGRFAMGAAALVALSTPAWADPLWLYERNPLAPSPTGQFYVTGSVSGGVQQLPRFRSTNSFFAAGGAPLLSATTFDPEVSGVEPGGAIGYRFRDGALPPWLGQRVRLEISGQTIHMTARETASRAVTPGEFTDVVGIGGRVFFGGGVGATTSYTEELRIRREGYALALRASSDHALAPNLVLSPMIAVFGGQTYDGYKYRYTANNAAGAQIPIEGNEKLRTNEIGFKGGAAAAWQFAPGWALQAAGDVGVVWMRTRLNGQDCFNNVFVPAGTPCGPSNGAFQTSSVSDSRSTVGIRTTASLGLSVDLRFAVATLGGYFRYDSRIPGVDNPQTATIQATGTAVSPARVRFEDGFTYGGFLRLVVPLSGVGL